MIETTMPLKKVINNKEVIAKLAETNNSVYNWTKLSEELFELGELVMKKVNKDGTAKEPERAKIIEEMGDVELRIAVLAKKYDMEVEISKRINEKLTKFNTYLEEDKYIGRI